MAEARVVWEADMPVRVDAAALEFLEDIAKAILADAKRLVPVDTGNLLTSLDYEIIGRGARFGGRSKPQARIGSRNVKYSTAVELGSKPRIIRPKKAKALYWEGARHPVRQVRHPGTKAQPYLRPALFKRRDG